MQYIFGWILLILGGALYLAQVISSLSFSLAQRLGIQEDPRFTDTLLQRAERYTAYWDLLTLLWLPLAGIFMVLDVDYWPVVLLIGGVIYFDASGREATKILSFRHEGVKIGADKQQKVFFASYIVMVVMAAVAIIYSLSALYSRL